MKFTDEFEKLPDNEKVVELKKLLHWYEYFADAVEGNRRIYDTACEYADEQERNQN